MWRDETGVMEMIFSYITDYQGFCELSSWRELIIEILSCHEEMRRQKITAALAVGALEWKDKAVAEEEQSSMQMCTEPAESEPHEAYLQYSEVDETNFNTEEHEQDADESFKVEPEVEMSFGVTDQVTASISEQQPMTIVPVQEEALPGLLNASTIEQNLIFKGDNLDNLKSFSSGRPYTCKSCGKSFTLKTHLLTHMKSHADDQLHVCKTCGKTFSQLGVLSRHLRTHTTQTPWIHRKDDRAFNPANTTGRPFDCKVCSRAFGSKAHLISHMRTHSGERPYPCKLCGKSFSQSGVLNRHLKIHSRPFSCSSCGKSFNLRESLERHELCHRLMNC